jgi:hypothetical protein
MPNKTEIRCFKRWLYLKDLDQKEEHSSSASPLTAQKNISSCTQWSKEEDKVLRQKVEQYGT